MNNESLVLTCACDDNFAMPMTVMLFSALTNLPKDQAVVVYILDQGIRLGNRSKLETCLRQVSPDLCLHWCNPDNSFLSKVDSQAMSPAVFDRFTLEKLPPSTSNYHTAFLRKGHSLFSLARLLPSTCKRAIFLDCDLIVQADLTELWTQDFEGSAVLAAKDYYFPTLERLCRDGRPADVDPSKAYFNVGVLACNLDFWRREKVEERLVAAMLGRYYSSRLPEQDAMNAVLHSDLKLLHPSWNVQVNAVRRQHGQSHTKLSCEAVGLELPGWETAKIIHYIGLRKPWRYRSYFGPAGGAHRRFFRVARATQWFNAWTYWMLRSRLRVGWAKRQFERLAGRKKPF